MVMLHADSHPTSCVEFEADVLVLYHSTTIGINYEAVVHANAIKQCARLVKMDPEYLRTGDRCRVVFRFLYWPVYLTAGTRIIFREGHAKGIGRVTTVFPYAGGLLDHKSKKVPGTGQTSAVAPVVQTAPVKPKSEVAPAARAQPEKKPQLDMEVKAPQQPQPEKDTKKSQQPQISAAKPQVETGAKSQPQPQQPQKAPANPQPNSGAKSQPLPQQQQPRCAAAVVNKARRPETAPKPAAAEPQAAQDQPEHSATQ
eukprot:TRINITY_DN3618_c0_g1_i2.p1 TRINITY_DN3618_c0_g1~~TRINITY_DN3618_c0_g1_i2.p1  ORF type:complete len:256 (-),score=60.29 TRINITY_DN3618_c0_g1_i2:132-899(-)